MTARGVVVRPMADGDARAFAEIHHAAVHGLAARDYPADVIAAWALPVDDAVIARIAANPDREVRFIAEHDGAPVGLGALVVQNSELRACYVAPAAARLGVGTALIGAIEERARREGLAYLWLNASLNAAPFYRALGYRDLGPGVHRLRTGVEMPCVRMRKDFPG